jgi:TolB-like protein
MYIGRTLEVHDCSMREGAVERLQVVAPLGAGVSDEAVSRQLERILTSQAFGRSDRHRRFLRFLVQSVLGGRSQDLTESRVAIEVFGRKSTFDSTIDPIVRVEAGRLRRRLREYYETEGSAEPLAIELPQRTYVPVFRSRSTTAPSIQQKPPRRRWRRAAALAGSAVVLGAVAVGVLFISGMSRPVVQDKTVFAAMTPAVAVLPVLDLGLARTDEALCDTLTEELIDELANTAGWRVVSRTSSYQYKGKATDVRKIGQELNAHLVLESSLRRQGGKVHVAINLVSAEDGFHIWTHKYVRDVAQIGVFEHELAAEAARLMQQQVWRSRGQ